MEATGSTQPETEALRGLLNSLVALVPTEQQGTARGIAKEIQNLFTTQGQGNQPTEGPAVLTAAHLHKVVTEAVKAAVRPNQGATQGRSWATVAAGSPTPSQLNQPTKIIPQRINREILVRGTNLAADLAKRTPIETIQAVNQTLAKKGAVAARKLPSGDIVVTFIDPSTKEWHSRNNQWIQQAFGEQAKEA